MLTLTEATEQTGKSKSTLLRAIRSGKLSANKNEHGDYRVDPSELFRVYKPVAHHDEPFGASTQQADIDLMAPELLEMIREKDQELSELRDDLKDSNKRLNEHRDAARLLEHKNGEWEKALADRKAEVELARAEANEMRERQAEQATALKAEQARVVALENRGLIGRIFNRSVKVAG